jgi:cholesterol transport system auxiliary component
MKLVILFTALLAGCSAFSAPKTGYTHTYLLDASPVTRELKIKHPQIIAVSMPDSGPGFNTAKMAYQQQPLELAYFATHRWADTPAHMLKPLLIQTLETNFRAVVPTRGLIPADIRLDTELIKLQQNFITNRIELTLRAQLTDLKDKRVIAVKLFDATEPADSPDAYGGVTAANRALQRILSQLLDFCLNATASQ